MNVAKALLLVSTVAGLTGTAQAQTADGEGARVSNDIIVTARRIEERLQDVPIAITAYTQEDLAKRNVNNASDLATYTPSLQADNRFGTNNTTFAVRGFRQDLRTSAAVGIYFADVVAQRGGNGGSSVGDGAGPGSFFDLQNVQVLKGPQGTLFGRNTTGGAILLVPQKPKDRFEGYVEGTYGNYNQTRLQGVVNVPLSDIARLRIGADWNKRDGYIKNVSGVGPDRLANVDTFALRASLVVDLTPDLENYTIVSYSKSHDTGPIAKVAACSTTNQTLLALCNQQLARQAGEGFWTAQNVDPDPRSILEQWQIINTMTYQANDSLRIKNISSYGQITSFIQASLQGGFYRIPSGTLPNAAGTAQISTAGLEGRTFSYSALSSSPSGAGNQWNFTNELQLQGSAGDALTWQAGAYYETSRPMKANVGGGAQNLISCTATTVCQDVLRTFTGRRTGNSSFSTTYTSFENVGVYAQGTYKLAPGLNATAGIRYTWDKTSGGGTLRNYFFTAAGAPASITGVALAPGAVPYVCAISGASQAVDDAVLANGCTVSGSVKNKAPTWLLSLDYKPIDQVMVYAKYSRGYRQGAYSANAPIGYETWQPERIDAYEAGLKASFDGPVRGTFNIAGFYNKLSNMQLITAFASSTGAVGSTVVAVNVGKSRVKGLEVDASITPIPFLTFDASYALLDTKILAVGAVPSPYGKYDIIRSLATVGSRFPVTPRHKFIGGATLRLPVPEGMGQLSVSASYTYTSDYDYTTGVFGTLPSTELVNANLTWNSVAGAPVDLSVFATNLLNEKYVITANDNRTAAGHVSNSLGEPRMYGMRLRYRFGS
ncbi:TonB-dependent receptor [Novosphingobium bradum]